MTPIVNDSHSCLIKLDIENLAKDFKEFHLSDH